MMKDYGVEESWTKFKVKGPDIAEMVPLCLMSDDDIVLDVRGQLILFSMREDQWWCIKPYHIPRMSYRAGTRTFMESLVSPIFGKRT